MREVDRAYLELALRRCGGCRAVAAAAIGIDRTELPKLVRRYGITPPPRGGKPADYRGVSMQPRAQYLRDMDSAYLALALRHCGSVAAAARALELNRSYFHQLMLRYGIRSPSPRGTRAATPRTPVGKLLSAWGRAQTSQRGAQCAS